MGDTMKGGNRSAEFLKVNPLGEVPALDLGNGKILSESIVICKYLNEMHGGSSVVGTTAEERADTDMWMMRAWDKVMTPMMAAFQSGPMFNFFKDRRPGCIHKELREPNLKVAQAGLQWFDSQLADGRKFLCGDRFSLADIRFFLIVKFFIGIDKEQAAIVTPMKNISAYFERVGARPSVAAIKPKPKAKM